MTPETKPKKKKSRIILIIAGVLVFLCVVCGIFGAISGSTPEAKATATARVLARTVEAPEATETSQASTDTDEAPRPTATLRPTNTVAPTNTPKPTKTSAPTNTPEPLDTSDFAVAEEAYRAEIVEISSKYGDAFTEFSKLATAVGEDASLLLDNDWKIDIAVVLVTVKSLNEEIRALDPPQRFVNVHSHLLEAATHYDRFVSLFTEGVDGLDVNKLNQATEELLLGNEAIKQATEKIKEIGD